MLCHGLVDRCSMCVWRGWLKFHADGVKKNERKKKRKNLQRVSAVLLPTRCKTFTFS
jgi:hypothetical protein